MTRQAVRRVSRLRKLASVPQETMEFSETDERRALRSAGTAHPLAQVKVELELAKLMMQKAATLQDAGRGPGLEAHR
jgi:hypothetical protein